MRRTKTQSRTPPTRPYPLHKKIKILFLGGTFIMSPIVFKGAKSTYRAQGYWETFVTSLFQSTSDVTVALKQCRQKCKCWAWGPEATEEHLCSWRHCFKVTVMTWWCHYYYETMTSGTQMFPSRLGPWGDWGTFVSLTSLFHGNRGIRDLAKGSKLYDLKRHHNMAGYKTQIRSYIT